MGVEPKLEFILSDVQVLSYFPLPQPIPNSPVSSQKREGLLSAPSNLYAPVTEIGSTQSGHSNRLEMTGFQPMTATLPTDFRSLFSNACGFNPAKATIRINLINASSVSPARQHLRLRKPPLP